MHEGAWQANILEVWGAVVQPPYIFVIYEELVHPPLSNTIPESQHRVGIPGSPRGIETGWSPALGLRIARDICLCAAHVSKIRRDPSKLSLENLIPGGADFSIWGQFDIKVFPNLTAQPWALRPHKPKPDVVLKVSQALPRMGLLVDKKDRQAMNRALYELISHVTGSNTEVRFKKKEVAITPKQ